MGSFPIVINFWAAVSITTYYGATILVMYYTRTLSHLKARGSRAWHCWVCSSLGKLGCRLHGGYHLTVLPVKQASTVSCTPSKELQLPEGVLHVCAAVC